MGLISLVANVASTVGGSISSQFADQYLEFFTCDALGQNVLAKKGANKVTKGNNKGSVDVISNGSKIAVPEGVACILVNNGEVVEFTTKAGMYEFNASTAPSCLSDSHFLTNLKATVADTWNRMRAGGEVMQQQRVYFINMQEIRDQKFGTATPLPYPDPEYRNIYIRLNGSFSFKIEDPVTFFKNVCSNLTDELTVGDLMGTPASPKQPREEFMDHMTEVLNLCGSQDKILFSTLPSEKSKLRKHMQDVLDEDWLRGRGMVVAEVALGIPTPDDKSRQRIEQVDQAKMFGSDPNALAAQAILGQTEAMNTAAGNANGAVNGFMGMGMVGGMGGANMSNSAFQFMGQQQAQQAAAAPAAPAAPAAGGWTCACGTTNTGKFCGNCGQPQPAPAPAGWTCSCGTTNSGKFCSNCGQPQPAAEWTCSCGTTNKGKFCSNCGKPQA